MEMKKKQSVKSMEKHRIGGAYFEPAQKQIARACNLILEIGKKRTS